MTQTLICALTSCGTDINGTLHRLGGNEDLYISCLKMFTNDSTVSQLNEAISERSWDEAFTAAHALKGLAGNMGFIPLMHSVGKLLVIIRGGRLNQISEYLAQVNSEYHDIIDMIQKYVC